MWTGNEEKTRVSRILYVSGFTDVVGGGQRSFFLILKNLDRARFWPVVLCPAEGEVSRAVSDMGIATVFLPQPALKTWRVWEIFSYAASLRRITEETRASLVHCDTLGSALLAGLAHAAGGAPVVFHARVSESGGLKDRLVRLLCDRIICVSRSVAARFSGSGRVRVVYNGVDTTEYRPSAGSGVREKLGVPTEAPLLGDCGQLVEAKGIETLLEAFAALRKDFPEARLAIAGRGAFEGTLRDRARALGLTGAIIFAGFMDNTAPFLAALAKLSIIAWLEVQA